jgi:DNA-binding transcriptional MerR regulator
VHVNTIRLWTGEYADMLSDSARSRPRLLQPRDVAVLQLVHSLRAEGLPRSAVLERLRQTPTADIQQPWLDAAPAVTEATETPVAPPVAQLVPVDVSAVLVDLAALVDSRATATQEAVSRVDERLRRLETQRSVWLGVAVGVAVGLVLGVILAAVLLLRL